MRVIAGRAGGLRLRAVPGRATRPTTDRVKESLFAILASAIAGRRVLDLFAGTGNLGIEALSRGAEYAVFVEKDRLAVEVIKGNVATTGLTAESRVVMADVFRALEHLAQTTEEGFDLVFLDPPYGLGLADATLRRLSLWPGLRDGAVVVVEHSAHDEVAPAYSSLLLARRERYGETIVSFYRFGS